MTTPPQLHNQEEGGKTPRKPSVFFVGDLETLPYEFCSDEVKSQVAYAGGLPTYEPESDLNQNKRVLSFLAR